MGLSASLPQLALQAHEPEAVDCHAYATTQQALRTGPTLRIVRLPVAVETVRLTRLVLGSSARTSAFWPPRSLTPSCVQLPWSGPDLVTKSVGLDDEGAVDAVQLCAHPLAPAVIHSLAGALCAG